MDKIFHGGSHYTGTSNDLENGKAILVHFEEIQAIDTLENLAKLAPDAQKIDIGGRTLLPGLSDAHRHLISASAWEVSDELIADGIIHGVLAARLTLEEGITLVRDPGCRHYGIFYLRRAIQTGLLPGPCVFAAGPNPTSEAAPKNWRNTYIHDPWTIRQAVRQLKRDGADWVKVIVTGRSAETGWKFTQRYLTDQELRAAADEAHAMGMKISGHIEAPEGTRAALDAGFDAIDHGTGITPEMAREMAERNIVYIPTLSFLHYNDIESVWGPLTPEMKRGILDYRQEHAQSFRCALEAGVRIGVGTDYAGDLPPEHALVGELELLIENGMPSANALYAATVVCPELVGKGKELGKLLPGYKANMIAVQGNPLTDIRALKQVDLVVKDGEVVISRL